mgnify:CR=1 FL=1
MIFERENLLLSHKYMPDLFFGWLSSSSIPPFVCLIFLLELLTMIINQILWFVIEKVKGELCQLFVVGLLRAIGDEAPLDFLCAHSRISYCHSDVTVTPTLVPAFVLAPTLWVTEL